MSKILIVDDDQDILANLQDILSDVGYEIDTALTGETALEKIKLNCGQEGDCYDLCLLDFKMPGMDGVELYTTIRELRPSLRAIMITAFAGDDGLNRAEQAGTYCILRKPVEISELLQMISEAVASSQQN